MDESIKDFMMKAYSDRELIYFVSSDEYTYHYDETLDSIRAHYNDFEYERRHQSFKSEKEAMDYVKEHKDEFPLFHIDVKAEFAKGSTPLKSFVRHGENNYIGKILTKKEVEELRNDPKTFHLCLRLNTLDSVIKNSLNPEYKPDVETYVQSFADGQVYPVFKYEKVLDKNLNQIYPVQDMIVEKLKGESR
ncbi:hypothetical protein HDR59_04135 [bacterium]|nr:hypothetical protein [bacterium]